MINNQNDTLILMIDVQEKLTNAIFNKDIVIKNANIILKASRILNLPIVITEQYPKGLGKTIFEINSEEKVYEKYDFNALTNKNILDEIKNTNRKQIVIFGIETHICVYQTVEALLNENFEVTVISDACGSRAEAEYISALDLMKNTGVQIKTTEMFLFELIKSSKHPNFKEIQTLIK